MTMVEGAYRHVGRCLLVPVEQCPIVSAYYRMDDGFGDMGDEPVDQDMVSNKGRAQHLACRPAAVVDALAWQSLLGLSLAGVVAVY
jgi:hypothetical protein